MSTDEAVGTDRPQQRRSVLRVVRDAPRPVWVLVAGVFLNRAGSFFATFLVLFLKQLGFTTQEMPLILLAVGIATPMGSLLGGWASDRLSRKASLVGSTVLASGGLAVIGMSPNRPVALCGVFATALFAQAYLPAASALLVDHTKEEDRVPIFAFFRLALNLGSTLGPLIAATVANDNLKTLFVISSCTYAAFSLLLWLGLPAVPSRARTADARRAAGGGLPPLRLILFYGSIIAITAVYVQYTSTVALAVEEGHSASAYALLLTLNSGLVILFEMPLSGLTRRVPWWIPAAIGTLLMTFGIVLTGVAGPYWLIAVAVGVWTVGEMLFSPVVSSATAALSPPDRVGLYQGYLATVQAVAFGLGPAVGTYLYGIGTGLLWLSCSVVGLLACLGFLGVSRWARSPG
ncbi:MFS transporter [Streptomyces sp. JJ38]|uniref:MFS transporter n=1 Tax=Streptomyces sp. JJ38 TaxID=2738128 RepID=UPI001C5A16F4|nr:MFS transporter [Streptomyces sp. JJ38]MBW1595851.1 MFS transporter [Streptomyces sp. JJ38]